MRRAPAIVSCATLVIVVLGLPAALGSPPSLPVASLAPIALTSHNHSYPVTNGSGVSLGNTSWRTIHAASGNPFENYLTTTPGGRILNWGGSYLRYSDTAGVSWTEVRPHVPFLSAEGAVTVAPGGDVLGVTWDPYTGDRVVAMKFTAASSTWAYMESPVHTPFYDRPWHAVLPGPFTVSGQTVPYLSVAIGGWPSKELLLFSTDGLQYLTPSSAMVDALSVGGTTQWLSASPNSYADWYQPNAGAGVAPVAGVGGVHSRDPFPCARKVLLSSLRWSCVSLPSGTFPSGDLLTDSVGRLHVLAMGTTSMVYRLSTNGGQSFSATTANLPTGYTTEEWDFKTNATLGITAVAVHAHRASDNTDRDFVFKFNVGVGTPSLTTIYRLGLGDRDFGSGVNASNMDRFDFSSVAILPSGKIVTSFVDSAHVGAAAAVEQ